MEAKDIGCVRREVARGGSGQTKVESIDLLGVGDLESCAEEIDGANGA